MIRRAIPVLHVESGRDATAYYVGDLGFELLFEYRPDPTHTDPCYCGLTRDGVTIHLSSFSGDGVAGGVVFLLVDDVDDLHREFAGKGIAIAMEPTDQTWGNREMYLRDPSGNSLRFIQASPEG